jgi:CheY-like chemotaxis protein
MSLSPKEFQEALHQALYHLYEPDRLRESPLATAFGVANRIDTFSRLQSILIEAIEALEPEPEDPAFSQRSEIYEPLYYRYVQQMPQRQVGEQLGMSVRHLRRKEHAAIELLAAWLWERYDLADQQTPAEEPETTPHQAPGINDELAWLRETPIEAPAQLQEAAEQALKLVASIAATYGVEIEARHSGPVPGLAVHGTALNQMLVDLLTAAVHHSPGGRVTLSAAQAGGDVVIRVCGRPGAPSPSKAAPENRACLDLAARMAKLSRGELRVQESASGYLAELTLPPAGRHTVLVIDDNTDTLQLFRRYTAGSRYRLVTTREPERALELAQEHAPQAIVLDVMMPHIDGWRLLGHLREHPGMRSIPILVCTIVPQQEMAIALGAAGYLQKPVTRRQFLEALDALVDHAVTGSR